MKKTLKVYAVIGKKEIFAARSPTYPKLQGFSVFPKDRWASEWRSIFSEPDAFRIVDATITLDLGKKIK